GGNRGGDRCETRAQRDLLEGSVHPVSIGDARECGRVPEIVKLTTEPQPRTLPPMMSPLSNQVAVVTEAGRGIGRAIALKFAQAGADVVCISRTAENSDKVAAEVREHGRRAWAHAVDVADSTAVAAASEKILSDTGRADVLVNNAGITRDGLLMRMSDEDWDVVLNTNLKGAFSFTKAFAASLVKP